MLTKRFFVLFTVKLKWKLPVLYNIVTHEHDASTTTATAATTSTFGHSLNHEISVTTDTTAILVTATTTTTTTTAAKTEDNTFLLRLEQFLENQILQCDYFILLSSVRSKCFPSEEKLNLIFLTFLRGKGSIFLIHFVCYVMI